MRDKAENIMGLCKFYRNALISLAPDLGMIREYLEKGKVMVLGMGHINFVSMGGEE